jgi:hypothetical protein
MNDDLDCPEEMSQAADMKSMHVSVLGKMLQYGDNGTSALNNFALYSTPKFIIFCKLTEKYKGNINFMLRVSCY